MASDFHTHHLPSDTGVRVLLSATEKHPGTLTSLEIHPWHLPEKYTPGFYRITEKIAHFQALGEVGLDKLRGPDLATQQKFLNEFLQIASETDKPVVFHSVRCSQEIFAMLKKFNLSRVMFHGFCGSPELLDELWKRNITVSVPEKILFRSGIVAKLAKNSGAYGFESDDSPGCDVRKVMKNSGIRNVEAITDQYFADFLRI